VMIMLVMSYVKYFSSFNISEGFTQASVFKNHIQANFLMAITAYFVLLLSLEFPKYRWLAGIIFVLMAYNILFMSIGRSGYVVFAVLMPLFLWQAYRWKGLAVAVLSLAVLSFAVYEYSHTFRDRVDLAGSEVQQYYEGHNKTSVGMRMAFAKNSIVLIKKHPVLGTATGSFKYEYAKLNPVIKTVNPHNEYLNISVQFGVVGLFLLLFLFFTIWRSSFSLPKSYQYMAQGILLAIAVGSLANSWIMDTTEGHFFAFFMALAFAQLGAVKSKT